MRILHATKKFPPVVGGDATAVSALARTQGRQGHEVHVLVYRAEGIEATDRVHPVGPIQTSGGLDRIGPRRLRGMRAMRRWAEDRLGALGPDIIHAHAVDVGASVLDAAEAAGIPVVLTCHGVWFPHRPRWSPLGWIERSYLRLGYGAVTSVDRASVQAIREVGVSKAILVPNGVDLSEFGVRSGHDGPIRFLFVGRHVYQKGIDVLLDAMSLARSRTEEPFLVEIAGDGPDRSRLERKAKALRLSDRIRFLGSLARSDLLSAYGRATVFVLPSRFEGFPLVILEAWAARLPVIATEVGGVPDLCTRDNAILVPADRPEAFADAMVSLVRDPARREALGSAGRSLVQERYTWDSIAQAYDRVYAACHTGAHGEVR